MPYRVERALHFSNGGGVYLGRTRRRDRPTRVVLKEARPHAGLDGDGSDAVTRLAREAAAMRALAAVPGLARLVGEHQVWEHRFLAVAQVPGATLRSGWPAGTR